MRPPRPDRIWWKNQIQLALHRSRGDPENVQDELQDLASRSEYARRILIGYLEAWEGSATSAKVPLRHK